MEFVSFTFRSDRYDVVHSRMVAGGIHSNRWRSYIRDIFRVLRPGGWCQMVEIYFNAQSDNGTLTRGKCDPFPCEMFTHSSGMSRSCPFEMVEQLYREHSAI